MTCLLLGAGALLLAVLIVGLLLAYLVDWDMVIRDAAESIEKEWSTEEARARFERRCKAQDWEDAGHG